MRVEAQEDPFPPPMSPHNRGGQRQIFDSAWILPHHEFSCRSAFGQEGVSCPPASLLGVICDFGRFRLSNWEPSESPTEGWDIPNPVGEIEFDLPFQELTRSLI